MSLALSRRALLRGLAALINPQICGLIAPPAGAAPRMIPRGLILSGNQRITRRRLAEPVIGSDGKLRLVLRAALIRRDLARDHNARFRRYLLRTLARAERFEAAHLWVNL